MNRPLEYVRELKKGCGKWTYEKSYKKFCSLEKPRIYSAREIILVYCNPCKLRIKTAVKMCKISQKKFLGLLDYPAPEDYEKRIMAIIKEFSEAIKEGREELNG